LEVEPALELEPDVAETLPADVSLPSALPMPIDWRAAKIAATSPPAAGGCVAAAGFVVLLLDVVSWLWLRVTEECHCARDAAIPAKELTLMFIAPEDCRIDEWAVAFLLEQFIGQTIALVPTLFGKVR
jgi:hypothetical protein